MNITCTELAQDACRRARLKYDDDLIDRAIACAEEIAEREHSPKVDTDYWRQGLQAAYYRMTRYTQR